MDTIGIERSGHIITVTIDHPNSAMNAVDALLHHDLAELFRTGLAGSAGPGWAWLTLAVWAVASPLLAVRYFRYY